jgi:hypothetical protein
MSALGVVRACVWMRQKNQILESDLLPRKSRWEAHGKRREEKKCTRAHAPILASAARAVS